MRLLWRGVFQQVWMLIVFMYKVLEVQKGSRGVFSCMFKVGGQCMEGQRRQFSGEEGQELVRVQNAGILDFFLCLRQQESVILQVVRYSLQIYVYVLELRGCEDRLRVIRRIVLEMYNFFVELLRVIWVGQFFFQFGLSGYIFGFRGVDNQYDRICIVQQIFQFV